MDIFDILPDMGKHPVDHDDLGPYQFEAPLSLEDMFDVLPDLGKHPIYPPCIESIKVVVIVLFAL